MSKRQLWAKSPPRGRSSGELLTDHLAASLQAMHELAGRVGRIAVLPERFWMWARLAVLLHDAGKVADGFQTMVGNGAQPPRSWSERHEVYSLGFVARVLVNEDLTDLLWVATGVATHHRPFTGGDDSRHLPLFPCYDEGGPAEFAARFGTVDPDLVDELADWLTTMAQSHNLLTSTGGLSGQQHRLGEDAYRLFEALRDWWGDQIRVEDGLVAVLLQAAVTLADHVSSAHGQLCTTTPLTPDYPTRLGERLRDRGGQLRPHQNRAAAVDGHLLLRAPTGSGKTEAALLWAQTQLQALHRATGGTPRVFYTLPYLASINAMADRLGAELDTDEIGVAHSRAASYHLARALRDDCVPQLDDTDPTAQQGGAAHKAVSRAAATQLFRELVRVGTPYQLLRGALAGPAHSSILMDAANSVFVLDELHAYDPRRLGMILAMMRLWEELGGRVAVLSATLPDALARLLDDTLDVPFERVELTEPWPQRHRVAVQSTHLTDPASITDIKAEVRAGQAVLVVANNVADARTLYEELAPLATALHGPQAVRLLHSRFRRKDRSAIEGAIQARFGTRQPRRPGLLVATQVVEVSLDVDFDVLHTSGAPLDALLQRFGRVNRLAARPPAPVVVHTPDYRPRRRGGPVQYADGVYEAEPTKLALDLLARHDGQVVDESEVGGWLNEIYHSAWGTEWRESVEQFRDEFSTAFLTFTAPFDDRSDLAEVFAELFDGEDAVRVEDRDEYGALLLAEPGRAGRLLAEELLIPIPHYTALGCRWDRGLGVRIIDAEYDPDQGLGQPRRPEKVRYEAGEVL